MYHAGEAALSTVQCKEGVEFTCRFAANNNRELPGPILALVVHSVLVA